MERWKWVVKFTTTFEFKEHIALDLPSRYFRNKSVVVINGVDPMGDCGGLRVT